MSPKTYWATELNRRLEMPVYTYKCTKCETVKDYNLPMGHHDKKGGVPTCENKKCKSKGCELQRVFVAPGVSWKCGGRTETTSETKEKNAKLQKLYKDSYVGD